MSYRRRQARARFAPFPVVPICLALASCGGDGGDPVTPPVDHTLAVTLAGAGDGAVTSNPAGIQCGASCQASFAQGTQVMLSAAAADGSGFMGWGGDCQGDESTCTLTLSTDRQVVATFEPLFFLDDNGVTVRCPLAAEGDTGQVSGVFFTKRADEDITPDNAAESCTSGITDMSGLFRDASDFDGDISHWDVSSVTDMDYMFAEAEAFNRDIGAWDVSQVESMIGMFRGAAAFDQDLRHWCVERIPAEPEDFAAGSPLADANKPRWGNCGLPDYHLVVRAVPSEGGSVTLVPSGGTYPEGTDVRITASRKEGYLFEGWSGDATGLANPLTVTVDRNLEIVANFPPAFYLADNGVTVQCPDAEVGERGDVDGVTYTRRTRDQLTPENASTSCTSGITDMNDLARDWGFFDEDIGHWDVSDVVDMTNAFAFLHVFNQDISHWDVSNVVVMDWMFEGAEAFNPEIGGWDVGSVTSMSGMFMRAEAFDQALSGWDVSQVQDMSRMFEEARSFNQDIGGWDVGQVEGMSGMFTRAVSFNQDLGGWDVSNVGFMIDMFRGATAFNQDLSGWCVSKIPQKPQGFDTAATGWTLPNSRPVWGTCPQDD